ncbi:Yos1-like protein [Chytriomyces sp. MP71]|nr:Yos1-like protein [Chytriomyces sp. MP71]
MLFATSLGTLFYVSVLCVNAIAILHEQRFLARIGLSESAYQQTQQSSFGGNSGSDQSITLKVINLISAVRTLLRIPLIAINILIIVYEILLG